MARAMLHNKDVARNLWGEVINTACHTVNRVYFILGTKKTPYEFWKGRKPNVKYFRIFGSTCFILKDRENMGKFDSRRDEGIFLGYFSTSKTYRVYNKRTMKVMDTENVVIDESLDSSSEKFGKELPKEILPPKPREVQEIFEKELISPSTPDTPSVVEDLIDLSTSHDSKTYEEKGPSSRVKLNHPLEIIVGNMNEFTLRKQTVNVLLTLCLLLVICHRLNPLKLKTLFRMKARWKLCMMNCFSSRRMMSGFWNLYRRVSTLLAQNGYSTIKLMRRVM